jgi:hypothetical protein
MKRTTYFLLAMTAFAALFVSACSGSAAPATQAAPPPAGAAPTQAPAEAVQPAQPAQPAAATAQTFAPACQAAASCAAPEVKDTAPNETYCVQKIPYQNIAVPSGTTFETLDPKGELKCQDTGTVVDGKEIITCTSKQLWTYQLKLTNSACGAKALATGTGQCQEGLGYDAAQNCCAPLTASQTGTGSVTIKVNMGACPLPH